MTTVTQFLLHPDDIKTMFIEVLKQASGNAATTLRPDDVPDQSATQAAKYLGCSPATLDKVVQRHPDKLKPITEAGKATRYRFAELYFIKSNNLVK